MTKPNFTMILSSPTGIIPLHSIAIATRQISDILSEIDKEISKGEVKLIWGLTHLQMSSPAEFEIAPIEIKKGSDPLQSIKVTLDGLRSLENKPERPHFFNDYALKKARIFVTILDQKNIDDISFRNGGEKVRLSHHLIANVDSLLPTRKEESIGAVDGRLEMVNVHSGLKVGIYKITDNKLVEVLFKDSEKMKPKVLKALEKRVYAIGELERDQKGEVKSIVVEDFEIVPDDKEIPKLEDIYGIDPNFTDGLSVEEFLRKLRDE